MTTTLLALYRRPEGGDEAYQRFERAYGETHLPLIAETPGLRALRVARVKRSLSGTNDIALVARMAFDDWDALKGALGSDAMKRAGDNLAEIGGADLATLLVVEEATDLLPGRAPGGHIPEGVDP